MEVSLNLLNKYKNIPVDYVLNQVEVKNNKKEDVEKLENEKKAILWDLDLI